MPIPKEVYFVPIPWDKIFQFAFFVVLALAVWYIINLLWFRIPNNTKGRWFKRMREGRGGWLHHGSNEFVGMRKDKGNAAGIETIGPAIRPIVCLKLHHLERNKKGEYIIVPDGYHLEDDNGCYRIVEDSVLVVKDNKTLAKGRFLGQLEKIIKYISSPVRTVFYGVYFLGPFLVLGARTNKWDELVPEGDGRKLTTIIRREYGFSVEVLNFGFVTEAAEAANRIPYKIGGEVFLRIENIDKATRTIDDSNYKAIALIIDEIVAWISQQPIYFIKKDAEGKVIGASEEPKESIKAELVRHLFNGEKKDAEGKVIGASEEPNERVESESCSLNKNSVVEDVRLKYGFLVSEIVILDIDPIGEFAKLLTAEAEAEITGQAKLRAEELEELRQAIQMRYTENWAKLFKKWPQTYAKFVADGIKEHGPSQIWGMSDISSLFATGGGNQQEIGALTEVLKTSGLGGLSEDEVRRIAPIVIAELEKLRKSGNKKEAK